MKKKVDEHECRDSYSPNKKKKSKSEIRGGVCYLFKYFNCDECGKELIEIYQYEGAFHDLSEYEFVDD